MKTLTKEFQYLTADFVGGQWVIDQSPPQIDGTNSGWRQPNPGQGYFINSTYFDLAGMSDEDKTLFFKGATTQEMFAVGVSNQAAGDGAILMDVMTTRQLTDAEVGEFLIYGNFAGNGPITFDQTVYARIRSMVVDIDTQAWGYMMTLSDNQIGSLEATASDRVYCYRAIALGTPTTADRVVVSPVRYILSAEAKEEPEYQYLMRLKRSYELQQEPDRD